MINTKEHTTVLLEEAVDSMNIRADGIYVDATFGRGGHSLAILARLGAKGKLIAIDTDPQAQVEAQTIKDNRFTFVADNFANLANIIKNLNLSKKIDGIIFDLGVSSPQLDDPKRGFSFSKDGPLDMRMAPDTGVSAAAWLNKAKEQEIADVLFKYGEERNSRKIAKAICERRVKKPFTNTLDLAETIAKVNGFSENKHPATRSFQAIRIFINNELSSIEQALNACLEILKPGANMAIITFHSLEFNLVKSFFNKVNGFDIPKNLPVTPDMVKPKLKIINKKILPKESEIKNNPRARSAKLAVAEVLE